MKTFTADQIRAIVLSPSMLTRQTMMRIGDVTGYVQVGKIEKCELYVRQAASGLITNEAAADKIVELLEAK